VGLKSLSRNWNRLGHEDPLWAVLSHPDKAQRRWKQDEFFATGRRDIADTMAWLASLEIVPGNEHAMDFGCGVGRLTQALAQHFNQVDGVDVARSMLNHAEEFNQFGSRGASTG
jgi:2-polyprenyl-3-methyl-5-hydroxy-6-metoxy-1,4-benzoquinol methylase